MEFCIVLNVNKDHQSSFVDLIRFSNLALAGEITNYFIYIRIEIPFYRYLYYFLEECRYFVIPKMLLCLKVRVRVRVRLKLRLGLSLEEMLVL